jgi:ubiquinone/menaquinone biosynthesis C-methylase UbiE
MNTNQSTIDFSIVAQHYDKSREVPAEIIIKAINKMECLHLIHKNNTVLDVGCGTGQFASCFAQLGYETTGIDISEEMLNVARQKSQNNIAYIKRDARSLIFDDCTFDCVVSSKLFLHIKHWQEAANEVVRVLKPGGCFMYCNELGFFSNQVRKIFRKLADEYGYTNRFIGEANLENIHQFFKKTGCIHIQIDKKDLAWKRGITYQQAFEELKNKVFVEFWMIPDITYQEMLDRTRLWIESSPEKWNSIEEMEPGLRVDIFHYLTKL